jgi:hypothetical protein
MLIPESEILKKRDELEQGVQLELIRLKQNHNVEKTQFELDLRRMKSDKEAIARDLELFSAEIGNKRKILTGEIESLVTRRDAEEKRLNARKPDYEKLSLEAENTIKSLELREKALQEGLTMVHEITADLEIREKKVADLETFYKGIEGDSFITRLNKLKNK